MMNFTSISSRWKVLSTKCVILFHISILILIPALFDTKNQFTNFPIYQIYKDRPVEIARENEGGWGSAACPPPLKLHITLH